MAGVRKLSPSATGVEMGCVVKVDPTTKKKVVKQITKHLQSSYFYNSEICC